MLDTPPLQHWCEDVPEGTRTIVCNCGDQFGEDAPTVEDGINEFADHIVNMKLREIRREAGLVDSTFRNLTT